MGTNNGFATFVSDDLPGFDSLNGSAFFDNALEWGDDFSDDSNSNNFHNNPANDMDFADGGGFEIVRSAAVSQQSTTDAAVVKKEVFFFESDDNGDEDDDNDDVGAAMNQLLASKEAAATTTTRTRVPKSSRRPKGDKKKPSSSDGTRKVRRNKANDDKDDDGGGKSVGSRGASIRRVKTAEETTRTMRRPSSKRPEKRGTLDLGSKLNKLESLRGGESSIKGGASLSRRASNRELGVSDEVSVMSRGVQSCAGASVGRRDARRRRATQGHALLARNLQHYDLATTGGNNDDHLLLNRTSQSSTKLDASARRRQRRQQQPLPIAA